MSDNLTDREVRIFMTWADFEVSRLIGNFIVFSRQQEPFIANQMSQKSNALLSFLTVE